MKLLASPISPYARKIRALLIEKQLVCEVLASESVSANHPAHAYNPLGKVPVLVLDDNSALFDSPLIAEYLDSLTSPALIPFESRFQVKQWEALADGICDAAILWVMELRRPEALQSADLIQLQRSKVERGLSHCAQGLQNRPFLVGKHLSLADIALVCALDYCRFRLPELNQLPAMQNLLPWLSVQSQRLSFASTAPH